MKSKHRRPVAGRRAAIALTGLATAAALTASVTSPAWAARGGGGKPTTGDSSSTMTMELLNSTDGVVNHGDDVTFHVTTTATDMPYVGLRCYQDGAFVYDAYVGYFDGYMFERNWFTLESPYWADGLSADCTARLFWFDRRGNEKLLATSSFTVAP
jgi:hypothetical protein